MHIEKNVFDNIFYTVMNVSGKTKDNLKVKANLELYCNQEGLQLFEDNGRVMKSPALYVLDKTKLQYFCKWMTELRLPDGYSSNISRCINLENLSFHDMKSHDCHIFMQQLLPIGLRELLPKAILGAIT
ncbi:hypothetical protein AXF42_Ash010052 [Apostasia shenzhenica]|uniref:Uncharacterized protein n=1 Tax=Apostasia shenzhenica TaxID=1088818 RepID=A0A2I0ACN9_9ASPA|nr:hypothetical protein AXF42_Ash010052 [Apostasia shenzhenica]